VLTRNEGDGRTDAVRIRDGSVRLGGRNTLLESADHFAQHMQDIPVLLLVCARLADVHPTDTELGRLSIVGGASVYPAVQNMILAARNEGLGTALTTLHCALEPQIKPMFNIPDDVSLAAVVMMGWPVKPFPTRLSRRPLAEMVFDETFDQPFAAAAEPG
jgi:nitroreductase